jgi:hypothetical protein
MQTTLIQCDACKQAIDLTKGAVEFIPLRGGLTLKVTNPIGNAGMVVNQQVSFCGPACLTKFVADIAAKIVPEKKPEAATPAAGTAAPAK